MAPQRREPTTLRPASLEHARDVFLRDPAGTSPAMEKRDPECGDDQSDRRHQQRRNSEEAEGDESDKERDQDGCVKGFSIVPLVHVPEREVTPAGAAFLPAPGDARKLACRRRRSAGEPLVGGPGGLGDEALAEEAGAVAEVAGAGGVGEGEPVEPLDPPARRLRLQQLEGTGQFARLAPGTLLELVVAVRRFGLAAAPTQLGEPDRAPRVALALQRGADFFDFRRQFLI
jgi:hypothetical protein